MAPFKLAVFSAATLDDGTSVEGKATLLPGDYFSVVAAQDTRKLHAWKNDRDCCSDLDFDCPINTTRAYRIPGNLDARGRYAIGHDKPLVEGTTGTLNVGSETEEPSE